MPYHKTKGEEIKNQINNTVKQRVLNLVSESVADFRDKLITVGYSLAKKASDNEEVAKQLCAVGEVVYDGFKKDNDVMKNYQDTVLMYDDDSLILAILNDLNYGIGVSINEENTNQLVLVEILGIIKQTYANHEIAECI